MIALRGLAVSPGVAYGVAAWHDAPPLAQPPSAVDGGRTAVEQFSDACHAAEAELRRLLETLRPDDEAPREILRAHLALVGDPAPAAAVHREINGGLSALRALERAGSVLAARFEAFANPALRSRAADLRDVCRCIARKLAGDSVPVARSSEPRVVCAMDLSPAQVVQFAGERPLAFVLESGSDTSHTAILMRALGVPAVIQVRGATSLCREGEGVIVDGDSGQVILRPDDSVIQTAVTAARPQSVERDAEPAHTRDGIEIAVMASIGGAEDARRAVAAGADGIGLFRTEWLFVRGEATLSEDDQLAAYEGVADAIGARILTLRTFDLGSDKEARGLELPPERNPALGLRGVRLSFARPELLRTQLRAVLRTCRTRNRSVRLLLPMVTDVADVARMRAAIDAAAASDRSGIGAGPLAIGVMVETPAAAMMADELAEAVDFLSIGTNDLTQYVLAADRENAAVAAEYQPLHPAVLRLVQRTIVAGRRYRKPVGICGEAAGNPLAARLFIGMGATELTVHAVAVATIKRWVRSVTLEDWSALATEVSALPTAAAVLQRLRSASLSPAEDHVRTSRAAR